MADEASPGPNPAQPGPPAGMQRPGVPGAGNILDPAVRADLREQLHAAVHGLRPGGQAPRPGGDDANDDQAGAQTAPPPQQTPSRPQATRFGAGPYPHGDVDLRFISANVPAEPIRPRRAGATRRFYFLEKAAAPADDDSAAKAPPIPPHGPKPG